MYSSYDSRFSVLECFSCQKKYIPRFADNCKNCTRKAEENAMETEEKLKSQIEEISEAMQETERKHKSQIEELNSTISFLRSSLASPALPFPDIVLVASDDDSDSPPTPANRAILASRSPVFRAMLEAEMAESITGTINVGEVSHDTLGAFVTFLYNGEANNLDEKMGCDLLVLAEKYQISHLKTYCEKFLINSVLTWENSLPLYAFARRYNSDPLLAESLRLILNNLKQLPQREDYAQYLEKDPTMLVQIYEAIITRAA